jgi:hypothetical protein
MGRKLFEVIVVLASFLAFGLIFVASNATAASNDLRVFVEMQPKIPNSPDGRFWEGENVKIELLLYNSSENTEMGINPPTKIIDWQKSNYKLFYVWDDLNRMPTEYRAPFAPIGGEHWLFAYSKNMADESISVVTKFLVQFRRAPKVPVTQHVYVSGETVKFGTEGLGVIEERKGQITAEATSTAKIVTPTPVPSNTVLKNMTNFFQKLVSGRTNLWIILLMIGLFLLVALKIIFKEKK